MNKFPKTPRIVNVLQQEDVHREWKHLHAVVQEKVDGANVGISVDEDANLLLQSRGHYLRGGPRERQFDLFKQWANKHESFFFDTLTTQYILYGEWMYAKHHIFYDALPHYFIAYDLYDKQVDKFVSSPRLQKFALKGVLEGCPICVVPTLYEAKFGKVNNFTQYIGPSRYKTKDWLKKLIDIAGEKELEHSDMTNLMEGVYVRIEDENWVVGRMKHPREEFSKVLEDDSHWMTRPIIQNQLEPGIVI
jgi:hypothetical protein